MARATKKAPIVLRDKIRLSPWPNKCGFDVTDTNPSRRCTAEVMNCLSAGWSVRIDKGGKVWKYMKGIKTETAEAAYEYCHQFGGPGRAD